MPLDYVAPPADADPGSWNPGRVLREASVRRDTDLPSYGLPSRPVSRRRTRERMGDLVQNRAADLSGVVQSCQRRAEPDEAIVVAAHARSPLRGVELHPPVRHALVRQQPPPTVLRLLKIHGTNRG